MYTVSRKKDIGPGTIERKQIELITGCSVPMPDD